jgi:hypothetical protein
MAGRLAKIIFTEEDKYILLTLGLIVHSISK